MKKLILALCLFPLVVSAAGTVTQLASDPMLLHGQGVIPNRTQYTDKTLSIGGFQSQEFVDFVGGIFDPWCVEPPQLADQGFKLTGPVDLAILEQRPIDVFVRRTEDGFCYLQSVRILTGIR